VFRRVIAVASSFRACRSDTPADEVLNVQGDSRGREESGKADDGPGPYSRS
jgi:hypothetical protein